MPPKPLPLDRIPPDLVCATDYERYARERLDDNAWAFVVSGAADELTLRWNREAFDRLKLTGRVLADVAGGHTRRTLFGCELAHPVLLAPIGLQRLVHPHGELATAYGAAAVGAGMVVSTLASATIEDIAATAQAPLWFQLYLQADRDFTLELVRRAEASGYQALMLTVDAPIAGVRNREQRIGFRLPPGVEAVNLRGMRAAPRREPGPGESAVFDGLMAGAPTWKDVAWLRDNTRLPLILKGIANGEDAAHAIELGADGLVVSNHGGRVLDTLPATIETLPRVAAQVGGRIPLLVDGGIRRGTDVLKALALGASAVMVGRAWLHALAAAGPLGVAHCIKLIKEELEVAMALTGCRCLDDIGPSVLVP